MSLQRVLVPAVATLGTLAAATVLAGGPSWAQRLSEPPAAAAGPSVSSNKLSTPSPTEPGNTPPPAGAAGAPKPTTDGGGASASVTDPKPGKPSDTAPTVPKPDPKAASLPNGKFFEFKVCNKSNDVARAAVNRRAADGGWTVAGWWKVNPGSCESVGYFLSGWFYYYADADDGGSWGRNDLQVCVRYPGPWERHQNEGYSCRSDEKLRGFASVFVENTTDTYTWTLNP